MRLTPAVKELLQVSVGNSYSATWADIAVIYVLTPLVILFSLAKVFPHFKGTSELKARVIDSGRSPIYIVIFVKTLEVGLKVAELAILSSGEYTAQSKTAFCKTAGPLDVASFVFVNMLMAIQLRVIRWQFEDATYDSKKTMMIGFVVSCGVALAQAFVSGHLFTYDYYSAAATCLREHDDLKDSWRVEAAQMWYYPLVLLSIYDMYQIRRARESLISLILRPFAFKMTVMMLFVILLILLDIFQGAMHLSGHGVRN